MIPSKAWVENLWPISELKIIENKPKNISDFKRLIEEKWQLFTIDGS